MGLCTAFVFAALVEFTIVNFWFRQQRYPPTNLFNQTNDVKNLTDSTSKAASKSTKCAYQINHKDGKLLGNNFLCKYHLGRKKELLAMKKETNGKI